MTEHTVIIEDVEKLYFEYYKLCEFYEHYSILQFDSLIERFKNSSDNDDTNKYINSFDSMRDVKSFDVLEFKRKLKTEFDELKKLKELNPADVDTIFKSSNEFITNYIEKIKNKIKSLPNSLDKAKSLLKGRILANGPFDCDGIYDAVVLLKDELPDNIQEWIYDNWKKSYENHKKKTSRGKHIFWVSRDFEENINMVSRYKIYELYEFNEFYKVFEEVEKEIEQQLLSSLSDQDAEISEFILDIAESKKLFNRYGTLIKKALENIFNSQEAESFWIRHLDETTPDIDLTAYSSLCLIKFAQNKKYIKAGINGAKWLLTNQNSEGSWNSSHDGKPNVCITLIALEAILRGKIPAKKAIAKGISWIMSQQTDFGGWDDILLDVSIINFLQNISSLGSDLTHYLKISKSYLSKSLELAQLDDMDYHRIAITTAYHGLEFFLYGLLSETNINQKVYDYKKKETIGFRSALSKLEKHLQANKILKPCDRIYNAGDLDHLSYLRDEIIHKAAAIDMDNTLHLISKAIDFMAKCSKEILKFDIWY